MRKGALIATFAVLILAFFVCGCEEEKSETENYGKNMATKTSFKDSELSGFRKKTDQNFTNLFQSASDFLALIDSSDEIQAIQNPRYKKEKEVQITLDKSQTEKLSERFSTVKRNEYKIKTSIKGRRPSYICEFIFKKEGRVLAKMKYYPFGRFILAGDDTWSTDKSLYTDEFIQSMGFYIPFDRKWRCRKEIKPIPYR